MKKYTRTLQNNETIIAVVASLDSKRREIADLLKEHGAKFINSYGVLASRNLGRPASCVTNANNVDNCSSALVGRAAFLSCHRGR